MDVTVDRPALAPGGPVVPFAASSAWRWLRSRPGDPGPPLVLLALHDGSLWTGRSIGALGPAWGRVRAVGGLVLVEGEAVVVLRDLEAVTPGAELWDSLETADGSPPLGFATAPGATLPIHGSVALAIARGEIGRP